MGSSSISLAEQRPPGGRDPAALALLPITLAGREAPSAEPIELSYQLVVDGRLQRFDVVLTSGREGWPTHADQMVYLALVQLALESSQPGHELLFRRADVLELLGWSSGGSAYERLDEALARLWGLGIVLRSALISRDGRPYDRTTDAVRVIDRYYLGRGRDAECLIQWGHPIREALRLGDFKRLDWELLLSLGNPLAAQLYRLIDRVVLSGEQQWATGWKPLAQALGMSVSAYARPARFKQVLQPHLDALAERGVIDSWDYQRGGQFVVYVRNYLRAELRRVLSDELGVYPDAARQIVAGYDEVLIMQQADCLQQGGRGRPASPGGYLTEAIRGGYELRYEDDDPDKMAALWGLCGPLEQAAYHHAGLKLCGTAETLFDGNPDPRAWSAELRATVRFLITWNLDPEEVVRTPPTLRAAALSSPL